MEQLNDTVLKYLLDVTDVAEGLPFLGIQRA